MRCLIALFVVVLTTCNITYAKNCRPKMCTTTKRNSYIFSCGFFGWGRCTRYRIGYQLVECGQICDPVDCKWGAWADTGSCDTCSAECGGGERTCTLTRSVIQKAAHGGKECTGSNTTTEKRACNQHQCPVDCKWGEWIATGSCDTCSAECGGGSQMCEMTRRKLRIAMHGGKECEGSDIKEVEKTCNSQPCPVDCKWTDWVYGEWEECSISCGGGQQGRSMSRTRDPAAAHGGEECDGMEHDKEIRQCNTNPCPVDCKWTEWTDPAWSDCSTTCGGGKQYRLLTRTQLPPACHGGKECLGSSEKREVKDCNSHPCPIDGGWTDWSDFTEWTNCSTNCDQSRLQSRTCTSPPPAYGGKHCDGNNSNSETRNCYQGSCLDQACLSQNANRAELPRNCNQFVVCQDENHVVQNCPTGTHWNQTQLTCVHEASSDCKDADDEESTTSIQPELEICIWPKYTRSGVNCKRCTENYVDTEECTNKYFWCVGGLAYSMTCPTGTHYNREAAACYIGDCS